MLASLVCVYAQFLSCDQLFATPWTIAHQAPLSMEFSRQEYWSGVAMSSSRASSLPRDQTHVSYFGRRILYHCTTWEAHLSQYFEEIILLLVLWFLLRSLSI